MGNEPAAGPADDGGPGRDDQAVGVRVGTSGRLPAAYEAALAVASEATPDAVLQRIVDLARQVVPARFAALGVADGRGRLTQFITSGVTPAERALIGPLPEGHGLLGELIRERVPLLIENIAADPRSVGFPANHPPMRTLLGTSILLGERVLGNLYLTERTDGLPFDAADLAALRVLATHAAAAIDRAHLYRRAEEQRDHLRVILDNLPAGVLILAAPDAHVELANAAAITMIFGPDAFPGAVPVYDRDWRMLRADGAPIPPDQRPSVRALQGEVSHNQQLLLERADGSRTPVLAQATPLRDAEGAIPRAVVVFQDVTRLRAAEQLKDDFLSLISHEFRTPLTSIHGGAYLLANQGERLDDQTRRELLADIVTESDRLDRMLGNLLTLTAVMAGRLETRTEPVLVVPLVGKTSAEIAARTPSHHFTVEGATDLPLAEGDPPLLAQVLRNLYENAVKYSPGGGEIRTVLSTDGASVTISVIDQGGGIAADQVDKIFGRFHRVGADPTVRGMGLGLYLSHHLIEVQGGHIVASSPGPGLGATFAVTLPVAEGWAENGDGR